MPQAVAAAAIWVGQTVGAAVGATLAAAGVTASVGIPLAAVAANAAYLVAELAIYAGLQSLIDDIANEKAAPQGYELALRNAADVPREMIIGQRPVAGSVVARYSWGSNLYNANFVYQLADHRCVELSKVYGDGRVVRDTPLAHGVRTEITAYSYSGGARVWMTWHDGRPGQTADADLITKSAQDPDVIAGVYGGWTSNHRGAGCAYVHVEVQFDDDILTSIPEFLFDVKGAPLYDRRKDSTAGGSGSHRYDDPSTWEWTANAAVALDHYMLGYAVEDDPLAFGVGLSQIEVPYATFAQLADLCDEEVATGEGDAAATMARFEANAIVTTAAGFEETIESFANQMCARVVDLGGQIGVLGAEERTSVVTLDDGDWASDESVRYAPHLAFSDLKGAVIGTFPDPANLWQPTPYQRQTTAYFQLPDGGEAPTAQLDLPFETNSRRAVRIAAAWIARESLQPRLAGTFATRSNAWRLAPGDWFTMSSERLQFSTQLFEVVDNVRHEDFTVTLTARAIDPAFLAFGTDQDVDLSVPPVLEPYDLRLDAPTFTPTATTIVGGGNTEPVISVVVDTPAAVAREFVIEAKEWNGTTLVGPSLFFVGHADDLTTILRQGLKPGTQYKIRMKARAGARESTWSDWSAPVTTSSTYIVPTAGEASSAVPGSALDVDLAAVLAAAGDASAAAIAAAASAGTASTAAGVASTAASNAAAAETAAETAQAAAETALAGSEAAELAALASQTAAATSASSASTAATNASTAATNASTANTNAQAANTAAQGAATTATTQATNSANSATAASGSATSAAGSATTATNQATAAGGSATAAAASATAAAASATAAGGSASAAATSASAANTSATAAGTSSSAAALSAVTAQSVANRLLPDRPGVAADFVQGAAVGHPDTATPMTVGTTVTAGVEGSVREFSAYYTIFTRGGLDVGTGRTFRVQSRVAVTVDGTDNRFLSGFAAFDSSWTFLGVVNSTFDDSAHVVADGWQTFTRETTSALILAAWPTAAHVRARIQGGRQTTQVSSGATWQLASLALRDITAEAAASGSATAAATSASNAATSASGASTSASAANTSATNAATSAGAASTSASNASTSATTAAGHAATSSTNATNAANSATAAAGSATAASGSASTASTHATNAGNSATSANTSATNAATQAGNASTSAGAASTSAGQASTSATNAASSASSASTSAAAAATSATAAGGSATAAATSATTASTAATNAGNSATAASAAQVAAESARDDASDEATAAATSASAAATSASAAGTSASSASTSATNAATSAGAASTSETNASNSATTASGHAATSATNATNAANSATAAGGSATAAAGSASTASTAATNAGNSATAAAASSVSAQSVANRLIPHRLENAADWGSLTANGEPSNIAAAAFTLSTVVSAANKGNVRRFTGTGSGSTRGWLPVVSGNTYRIVMELQCTAAGGATNRSRTGFRVWAADGTYLGAVGSSVNVATDATFAWTRSPNTVTGATILAAQPTAAFVRATFVINENATPGTTEVATIELQDITSETLAAGSATAAASSASSASTSASGAATSASAANTSATNAATSAGAASTSATNAATSATTASGHAATSSTNATNAANSATAAGGSATAAAGSASTAGTAATNAGNSATAAAASAVTARSVANSLLPERPGDDVNAFTTAYTTYSNPASLSTGTVQAVTGEGNVYQYSGQEDIAPKGLLPVIAGRTYRLAHRSRIVTDGTGTNSFNAWFRSFNSAGTYLAAHSVAGAIDTSVAAADGWLNLSGEITAATILAAQPTAAYIRADLRGGGATGVVWQNAYLQGRDVTAEAAAAASASAAATSASSASTSASGAATSASAAAGSATTATTQASNASTSAGQASTSAGNAATSASTASTQASNAAASASTATTQASNASASASAASSSATLSANYAQAAGINGLLPNAKFLTGVTGGIPNGWTNSANATGGTQQARPGTTGAYIYRLAGAASTNNKIKADTLGATSGSIVAARRYRAKATTVLGSGTYNGAGLRIDWMNAGGTVISTTNIGFANTPTTNGLTANNHTGLTSWEVVVTAPALAVRAVVHACSHDTALSGGYTVANSVDWYEADLVLEDFTSASVSEVKAAITDGSGAYAYYGMKLDAGGRFVGWEAMASSKTGVSEFRITAATFKIYDGASDIAMFEVAGGAAYVAGSKVRTESIVANAVTQAATAYTAGTTGQTAVGDGYVVQQTLTITATGAPLLIFASLLAIAGADPGGYCSQAVRIRRGSTTLYSVAEFNRTTGADTYQAWSTQIVDTPSAGSVTYTIETTFSGSDISRDEYSNRSLAILEVKK